jgi:hypothetical protein
MIEIAVTLLLFNIFIFLILLRGAADRSQSEKNFEHNNEGVTLPTVEETFAQQINSRTTTTGHAEGENHSRPSTGSEQLIQEISNNY